LRHPSTSTRSRKPATENRRASQHCPCRPQNVSRWTGNNGRWPRPGGGGQQTVRSARSIFFVAGLPLKSTSICPAPAQGRNTPWRIPWVISRHLPAVEIGRAEVAMTRGVDAGQVRDAELGDHRVLKLAWTAVLENHVRIENSRCPPRCCANSSAEWSGVRPWNMPLLNAASSSACSDFRIFSGLAPHIAPHGPRVEQVKRHRRCRRQNRRTPPADYRCTRGQTFSRAQAVQPAGSPQRNAGRWLGLLKWQIRPAQFNGGVLAAESVVWIDAKQIGQVGPRTGSRD